MQWALIVDGTVREITDIDPEGRFHPELVWVSCGPEVAEGWSYKAKKFAPPPPLEEIPMPPIALPVDAFFERTTEAEAEAIEEAMLAKPVKIRRAYQAAAVLTEGTDLWAALVEALAGLFTADRASELLQRP